MSLSGIDISKYKSHRIRGVAASKASSCGLPIKDIMKVAGWVSDKTFAEFYNKPVENSAQSGFQSVVLSC